MNNDEAIKEAGGAGACNPHRLDKEVEQIKKLWTVSDNKEDEKPTIEAFAASAMCQYLIDKPNAKEKEDK